MRALDPDLDAWMILEGYGKTLSRGGLSVADASSRPSRRSPRSGWRASSTPTSRAPRAWARRQAHVARALTIGQRCRRTSRS
jgi:hypothetical protein